MPGDDNDKNSLFVGLNIRITELYVKQKGIRGGLRPIPLNGIVLN
jgi:hypothetical protein